MRVFAALPLPPEAANRLYNISRVLKEKYPSLKVVKNAGFHITLIFFGELSEIQVEQIKNLMDDPLLQIPVINASFGGIGQFPPRGRPRVIYCPVDQGKDDAIRIYRIFMDLIGGFLKEDDKRDFVPHITLARNKGEWIDSSFIRSLPGPDLIFTFDRLVLYRSVLKKSGADYTALKTVMFR